MYKSQHGALNKFIHRSFSPSLLQITSVSKLQSINHTCRCGYVQKIKLYNLHYKATLSCKLLLSRNVDNNVMLPLIKPLAFILPVIYDSIFFMLKVSSP